MASQTELDDFEDFDELDDESVYLRPSVWTRVLWGAVFTIGGALLLALLTLASVAVITPQFFRESCQRTELVTPAGCTTVGVGGFAGSR